MRSLYYLAILFLFSSCNRDDDSDVLRRNYVISKTNELVPETEEPQP